MSLVVAADAAPSPPTGRILEMLRLANAAGRACYLDGYPTVVLRNAKGAALPFAIQRRGGMVVTDAPPKRVDLAAGASAYFLVEKYRCDGREKDRAVAVSAQPPGARPPALQVTLPEQQDFGFCGVGDAGNSVYVSPVVPDPTSAIRRF